MLEITKVLSRLSLFLLRLVVSTFPVTYNTYSCYITDEVSTATTTPSDGTEALETTLIADVDQPLEEERVDVKTLSKADKGPLYTASVTLG